MLLAQGRGSTGVRGRLIKDLELKVVLREGKVSGRTDKYSEVILNPHCYPLVSSCIRLLLLVVSYSMFMFLSISRKFRLQSLPRSEPLHLDKRHASLTLGIHP